MRAAVSIPLSSDRMDALHGLYINLIGIYEPDNDHEKLLLEHAKELQHRMAKMLFNNQKQYTIGLSNTEAMAFYQLWTSGLPTGDIFSSVIIDKAVMLIDKMKNRNA